MVRAAPWWRLGRGHLFSISKMLSTLHPNRPSAPMSAVSPKAGMCSALGDVRLVPEADIVVGAGVTAPLLAVVPNVDCELPVVSDFFPDDDILPGDFLWRRTLGLQANRADLTRRRGAE